MSLTARAIPAAVCGCENAETRQALISVEDALEHIAKRAVAVQGEEQVCLTKAAGRVLARDIFVTASLPRFDNSAMDGFAIRFDDIGSQGEAELAISQRIEAGKSDVKPLEPGTCARIFTGAPMPVGADTVIAQEDVSYCEGSAHFATRRNRGQNVRWYGEDMAKGALALAKGTSLDAPQLGLAAALGFGSLPVRRKIRVAILRSGNEIVEPGQPLAGGQIYDVNGTLLRAALQGAGVDLGEQVHCADNFDQTRRLLTELALEHDLVLTTGGVSVGSEDHVLDAFKAAGGQLHFSGVALKPGKPVTFGTLTGACFLGLPGNPLACLAGWTLLGRPLVAQIAGGALNPQSRFVAITAPLSHRTGRRELRFARLGPASIGGLETASPAISGSSAHVSALVEADGFVILPEGTEHVAAGTPLEFIPLGA